MKLKAENRAILKPEGLLTRDPRMVEHKKIPSQKKHVKIPILKTLIFDIYQNIFSDYFTIKIELKKSCRYSFVKGIGLTSKFSRLTQVTT